MTKTMKAAVFVAKNRIVLEDKPVPDIANQRDGVLKVAVTP